MKTLEQKIAVMQAALEGKKIVCTDDFGGSFIGSADTCRIVWNWHDHDYSVYEEPKTKPSIDWSHVHPNYNYLAVDSSGTPYLFYDRPSASIPDGVWTPTTTLVWMPAYCFSSFVPGTCNWEDSLVKRP
jgi:hypothetical protein